MNKNKIKNRTKKETKINNIENSNNKNIINKKSKRTRGKINNETNSKYSKDDTINFKYVKDFINAQDLNAFCNYLIFKSINDIYYLISYLCNRTTIYCFI